jgi:hypothetical protein
MKNLLGVKNIKVTYIDNTKDVNKFIEKHDGHILDITPINTSYPPYGIIFYITYVDVDNTNE